MTGAAGDPVRVGLLADPLEGAGGMGRYAREVLRALGRRADVEPVVVIPRGAEPALAALELAPGTIDVVPRRGLTRIGQSLWERHRAASTLKRLGVEVVHGMKHLVPRGDLPTVLTVHDLLGLSQPAQFDVVKRVLLPREYRASLRSATVLVAVSAATRDRLGALDPRLAAKTLVAPNGFTDHLLHIEPVPVPALAGRRFALIVGDLSPRKNVRFVIDLWPEVQARSADLVLAVAGSGGSRSGPTRRALDALVKAGRAVGLGRIEDDQLRWCYEHAAVALAPSLEEGFGLPVVEAASFGAPVVANAEPALIEAGRGWPTFVPVEDRPGWIDAIIAAAATPRRPGPSADDVPTWDEHVDALVHAYRLARPRAIQG